MKKKQLDMHSQEEYTAFDSAIGLVFIIAVIVFVCWAVTWLWNI
jgi:flagellar biogenesis protein FliO